MSSPTIDSFSKASPERCLGHKPFETSIDPPDRQLRSTESLDVRPSTDRVIWRRASAGRLYPDAARASLPDQTPARPGAEPRASLPLPRPTVQDRIGGLICPVSQATFHADPTLSQADSDRDGIRGGEDASDGNRPNGPCSCRQRSAWTRRPAGSGRPGDTNALSPMFAPMPRSNRGLVP